MKRTKVQIEKQTKRAYLICDESGRKGWIQKRWLAADKTVSEKTMTKADENYKEQQAGYAEAKQWQNAYHVIKEIARQTDKAIAVNLVLYVPNIEKWFDRLLWIPKSLIKNQAVQGWFVIKKIREQIEELKERVRTGAMLDSVDITDCDDLMIF